MKCKKETLRLYAVTDRTWLCEKTLLMQVEEALQGGVTCVQLREKKLQQEAFLAEALAIKALCQRYGVPLFINDNVELAIRCGADGVHVGQRDCAAALARRKMGSGMVLGVSAQSVAAAKQAQQDGANYLGVGAAFATTTKPEAHVISHETLRQICAAVSIPVVAIGGISKQNIMQLAGTGVAGVALVSAIFAAQNIQTECEELRALSGKMVAL